MMRGKNDQNQEPTGRAIHLLKLVKSSGFYALSSVALPLISLALAPFLTHELSPADYGILAILNTLIGLGAGISQLGLGSAFFRAYGYDYTEGDERRQVLSTMLIVLSLVSLLLLLGDMLFAPLLASLFLGRPALGSLVLLAGVAMLLQNMTVPGFAWLRAENRALLYSLLSVSNLLVTLAATIVFVGVLHFGPGGSLLATCCGYGCALLCTVPIVTSCFSARPLIRIDIARNLLGFGLPLVLSFLCSWVLQLSDRYLLSLFSSLAETARYSVAYTLGSAISVVVIAPFSLAWPAATFAIARQANARQTFRLVFRWFVLLLLLAAFALALLGEILLQVLFPPSYRASSTIIPVVALSLAIYGVSFVVGIGIPLTRRNRLGVIYVAVAALLNLLLNLVLIPRFGALGAAVSTLAAYGALTLLAYVFGRRIYPVAFEIGLSLSALLLGVALYIGNKLLVHGFASYASWGISLLTLCLYAVVLILLGFSPTRAPGVQQVQEGLTL